LSKLSRESSICCIEIIIRPMSLLRYLLIIMLALPVSSAFGQDEIEDIDPWEPVNRKIFAFNETVDRHLLRPVASGYHKVMPDPAERGVANFISNIYEFNFMLNALLQGRPSAAAQSVGRFMVNTTVGVLGLFDVATKMGIEAQRADFGQTLKVWGVGRGPYVMLPLFGPRTVRSATGYYFDIYTSIPPLMWETKYTYLFWTVELISYRAGLLEYDDLITGDRYVFMRSAYLQSRATFLNDGVPLPDDFSDFEDDEDWE
jgi:phospholipid-binding lipoprotein MlaA